MKKIIAIALLILPLTAFAAPVSWDFASGVLQPLQSAWSAVVKGSYFQATSSTASIFPFASTTVTSATSLCLSTDCRTTWPVMGANPYEIATTTTIAVPDLAYFTKTGGRTTLGSVATTTLTINSPLTTTGTIGALVGGTNSSISCQTASGSQAGCLSSTDWTTFNSKQNALTLPLSISNGGTGTSTTASGYAAYWGATTLRGVATTSVTAGSGITFTGTAGALLGGTSLTIAQNDIFRIATTSSIAISGVSYFTKTSGVTTLGSVATTSVSCSSPLSCGAFDVLTGGGAISLGTVGISNGGTGLSSLTGNRMLYSNNAGSSLLQIATTTLYGTCSGGQVVGWSNTFGGLTCIATSTGSGTVTSVDVSGGTTGLTFSGGPVTTSGTITMAGTLGIANGGTGTTTTASGSLAYWGATTQRGVATSSITCTGIASCANLVTIASAAGATTLSAAYDAWTHGTATNSATTSALGIGTTTPFSQFSISTSTQSAATTPLFGIASTTNSTLFNVLGSGFTGIGTTSPFALLSVNNAAATWPLAVGSTTGMTFGITPYGGVLLNENRLSTSTTKQLDWSQLGASSLYQTGTSATTITFINATTSLQAGSRKMVTVCNPGASAGAITWRYVEWAGGTAPTQTTTANQCDVYSFFVTAATSTSGSPTYKIFGAASTGFQ